MVKIQKLNLQRGAYITPQGLVDIKSELEFLKKIKKSEITQRIQRAREFGNLADNSEYDAVMEEQVILENRIAELDNILKSAQVIHQVHNSDFVVIGSTVVVEIDGEIDEFTIVGRLEANPAKKKISNESPLGSAILGAKAGEAVEVTTPIVKYQCKVLEIK